jgi:hypothetical protein
MKVIHSLFLVVVGLLFVFCERTDCCPNPEMELEGVFTHAIPDCGNTNNPEINCTEWLEFVNEAEANLLYGGGDMVQRFTYTLESDVISLQGPLTSSFRPVFLIKNRTTLERMDNGDLWIKE